MRNIKRALSLALASVMLLGMMVVGSSAAFNDADKIVNTKAATVTAGLGLFAGTTDGNFDPAGTVTRAQMATVISKMIYGSEVNADSFKGQGKFSDTAAFEGGWAEGYVNLCVNLGVVSGYGDGTFRPGNAVTTAEAVTMLINALKVDAGEGQWPMTVMAAAETIKLFTLEEELAKKPATNAALTRDELSVMVLNALYYSPEGGNVYVVDGNKFDSMTDAYFAAGQDASKIAVMPAQDTLATETFDIQTVTGWVTGNQATGDDYTVVNGVALDLETGLDMIGHYVTAYYAEEYESEDEPGIAYCIADEGKYVVVEEEIDNDRKAFTAAFGTKDVKYNTTKVEGFGETNYKAAVAVDGFYWVDSYPYVYTDDNETPDDESDDFDAVATFPANVNKASWDADAGTYVFFEGTLIGYIAPAAKALVEIGKVTTTAGKESIRIAGQTFNNAEDNDEIVEYEGIAQEDIAILVAAQNMAVVTKAEKFEGKVTRTGLDADNNEILTIDGKTYVIDASVINGTDMYNEKADVDFNFTYTFYTCDGKIVAFEELEGSTDLGDIVYAMGAYEVSTVDAYGNDVTSAYAQVVNMEGKESAVLIGIEYESNTLKDLGVYVDADGEATGWDAEDDFVPGFKVFELSKKNSDEKKANIMVEDADAIATEPEAEKATIFVDQFVVGSGANEFDAKTTTVDTEGGELAFLADSTKFILIDGAAGKTLEVAVKTGATKLDDGTYNIIASADKSGNVTLEVIVFAEDGLTLPSADLIYVSEAQIAQQATVAEATELEVYFVATKEFKTINVETALDEGDAGFYSYTFDAVENIYTELDLKGGDEQLFYGLTLTNLYGGNKLVAGDIKGLDASNAAVIDTRSESDLEKSDFAEVEDLADLADLVSTDIEVTIDVMLDEEFKTVVAIFVTAVEEA